MNFWAFRRTTNDWAALLRRIRVPFRSMTSRSGCGEVILIGGRAACAMYSGVGFGIDLGSTIGGGLERTGNTLRGEGTSGGGG